MNIKLDLPTGGALKKGELPLKLLMLGDYSSSQDTRALADVHQLVVGKIPELRALMAAR